MSDTLPNALYVGVGASIVAIGCLAYVGIENSGSRNISLALGTLAGRGAIIGHPGRIRTSGILAGTWASESGRAFRDWTCQIRQVRYASAMRASLLRTSLRLLTWVCVVLLAVVSLTPFEAIEAVRTDLPGQVEHIIAYAGSGAIAMAGYGLNWGT
jgi:hypothetical protein